MEDFKYKLIFQKKIKFLNGTINERLVREQRGNAPHYYSINLDFFNIHSEYRWEPPHGEEIDKDNLPFYLKNVLLKCEDKTKYFIKENLNK